MAASIGLHPPGPTDSAADIKAAYTHYPRVAWRASTTTANSGVEYRIEIDNVDDQVVLYAAHAFTDASGAASHSHSFVGGLAIAGSEARPTVSLDIFVRQDASGVSHDSLVHVYGYLVTKQ